MCGIAGFVNTSQSLKYGSGVDIAIKMSGSLRHRGPDDGGIWHNQEKSVFLSHRRLSIVDLSEHGKQPMYSISSRYVLVFNGEIYNHLSLRSKLESKQGIIKWKGRSDTETLLACIDFWGLKSTLEQCRGMFSLALFDRKSRVIYLARDRLGEKPLYYGMQNGVLLFGSELKALKAHPAFLGNIDRESLSLQLRHSYIPSPHSIYQDVKKLTPGTILKVHVDVKYCRTADLDSPTPYWSLEKVAFNAQKNTYTGDFSDAVENLEYLLIDSIKGQMGSDVPLGAFLSGGIDSSLIVALMQSQSINPVETFSIGFKEMGYNEAIHAKLISQHLGTKHTEMYVSAQDAMDVIPNLPTLYDEPFSDSSQIPTYLLSQVAKRRVDVSLSGDAGDELFGGYNRYLWVKRIWEKSQLMPVTVRRFLVQMILRTPYHVWDKVLQYIIATPLSGEKMHKLAKILSAGSIKESYFNLVSHWQNADNIVVGSGNVISSIMKFDCEVFSSHIEQEMMYLDMFSYLPDDILTKVDRAAMGVSLETRVPFLDHHVVEFACQLPLSMKIKNGEGKWILRRLLDKHIPRKLIERPKMGFGVPIDTWLREDLKEWAEDLLDEDRLKHEGFLHAEPIKRKWDEHLSRKRNWQHDLWDVLMFQLWLEGQK